MEERCLNLDSSHKEEHTMLLNYKTLDTKYGTRSHYLRIFYISIHLQIFHKENKGKGIGSKCFIDSDTISTYPYTYSNQITCDCTSYIHLQRVLVCSANGLQKESLWSKWIHSKGGKYYLVFPEHNECILPSLT